jgi:hypothetical protein
VNAGFVEELESILLQSADDEFGGDSTEKGVILENAGLFAGGEFDREIHDADIAGNEPRQFTFSIARE